jgi:S-adenosylmethionine synthetase
VELALHVEREPDARPVEVVERKGRGHPDTLCDAIAERISVELCRYYLERFGAVLHHNVDKVLLCGGAAVPAFGGGELGRPIEIYLAGRATRDWRGEQVPVDTIAIAACQACLRDALPALELDRHVRIVSRIGAGSAELVGLFARGGELPRANDTSCGAGFAPASILEQVVREVDRAIAGSPRPERGADLKIMGVRRSSSIELTIACAFIGRHLADLAAYVDAKRAVRASALEAAHRVTGLAVDAVVNAADDEPAGQLYLTVTGTSAEAGDDGEVGRGNRVGGLITPYRPMTLEAAAGKNPVSHVGKLYNVMAPWIAARLAAELPTRSASCVLVSQIGRAIDDPQLVDIGLATELELATLRTPVLDRVRRELGRFDELRAELLAGRIALY